ncbi:4-carboxymuconolactone decarboxylase [Dactylosporangium vinaceum]|uniref:bifunctional 3-oxoadipate enol-lactonase/4-carboxymuconolactone decarboxylase PcaDC n=1 Tax=Dactylosporangium vinaceum TaxID=53362 RepID=UPI001CA81F81|nr:4-carboxymuconolactone decarboxylase [Dactylosporangium vinaceum]UAB92695.1 4-carboxymuconolactone decarboxylase [Dactylosporangium vinaceum]
MTTPTLTGTELGVSGPQRPLLVLGPSLGTSAAALWARCAGQLRGEYQVIAWDLPGHGRSAPAGGPLDMADLARGVLDLVDTVRPGAVFGYAGVSVGGAVGLQLLLDAPQRVSAAALLCTGARIGAAAGWRERAELVRGGGTAAVVDGSLQRWFTPGFRDREPGVVTALIDALRAADAESYARVCAALETFDVRPRLAAIAAPVLAVAGGEDLVTPAAGLAEIAGGVRQGRLVVLDAVGHVAPAERPAAVAVLLDELFDPRRAAGGAVRRAVLGNAHVDRAAAGTTPFTRDFQDLVTGHAWHDIWGRPGLDRRSRSLVTLTALVALGHHEELAMHVRAARANGLSDDEIAEVLLQTAIYCGVPAANSAFRIAQRVLRELDGES